MPAASFWGSTSTFGEYDWLSIAEVPDAETNLAVLLAGISKATVSDVRTTLAVTPEALQRACRTAATLAPGFEPPGAADAG